MIVSSLPLPPQESVPKHFLARSAVAGITAAASVSRECKTSILDDMKLSLSRPGGKWHGIIEKYRKDVLDLCKFKPKDRATLSARIWVYMIPIFRRSSSPSNWSNGMTSTILIK